MPLLISPFTAIYDASGHLRPDASVFVFRAGTSSPASIYTDASFSTPAPNPCPSQAGLMPALYGGVGSYRFLAVDGSNATIRDFDDVTIEGGSTVVITPPSGGGGSGGTVDPTMIRTGDAKFRYGTGELDGWVRANGRSIGNAGSGATERANADTQALFFYLWAADPNLAVSGGRGTSASADWTANKTINLPDMRGRMPIGLDDMGNQAAGRMAGALFAFGSATALGSYGGEATHVLTADQMPSHTHNASGSTDTAPDHTHPLTYRLLVKGDPGSGSFDIVQSVAIPSGQNRNGTTLGGGSHSHAVTVSVNNAGSGAAYNQAPPFLFLSIYIRL